MVPPHSCCSLNMECSSSSLLIYFLCLLLKRKSSTEKVSPELPHQALEKQQNHFKPLPRTRDVILGLSSQTKLLCLRLLLPPGWRPWNELAGSSRAYMPPCHLLSPEGPICCPLQSLFGEGEKVAGQPMSIGHWTPPCEHLRTTPKHQPGLALLS